MEEAQLRVFYPDLTSCGAWKEREVEEAAEFPRSGERDVEEAAR